MSRIESLTEAQIARFPEFVERWTQIGLCTDPAERPRAEAAIREMYRQGGLESPARIVWCGSPLSQQLTEVIIMDRKWAKEIGDSVHVVPTVWHNVVTSVRYSVDDSVRASVEAGVLDSVRDSVGDSVPDNMWAVVWNCLGNSLYGSHDAGWLAFYRYFHDVTGLTTQTEKLSGLWELAQSAGPALQHRDICWVSERHHILERDGRGRLHCLNGPAVAYPDGWAIYAVHGVRVPRHVIEEPGKIGLASIRVERNIEVRRVMIERYRHGEEVSGAAAYVRDSGAERLDHDERFGTLYRRNIHYDEPIVMLEVVNSTPEPDGSFKRYWLRVPPHMQTAREAVAWTFNMPGKDYTPTIET
jgi:hypothetical protein